jgi:hypothetical protein
MKNISPSKFDSKIWWPSNGSVFQTRLAFGWVLLQSKLAEDKLSQKFYFSIFEFLP